MEKIAGQPDIELTYAEHVNAKKENPFESEPREQVHNPKWYDWFDMSVIEMMEKVMTTSEYIGFLKGQSIKYRMRSGRKATTFEDIEKAKWYEERYQKFVKENTQ